MMGDYVILCDSMNAVPIMKQPVLHGIGLIGPPIFQRGYYEEAVREHHDASIVQGHGRLDFGFIP